MRIPEPLFRAALLALAAPPALAQVPRVVARQMGPVPPIGRISWIEDIEVTVGGSWAIEADTTFVGSNEDGIILKDDVIELREGDFVPTPPGTQLRFFQSLSLARDGRYATVSLLKNTVGAFLDDGGVFLGDKLVIQENATPIGAGWQPGTYYVWFSDVDLNANGQILVRGYVEDPIATGCIDYFASILDTDANGNLVNETLLAVEAGPLPGISEPCESVRFGPDAAAFNDLGQALIAINLDQGPDFSMDGTVWLFDASGGGTMIAREGTPSPVPGRNWGALFRPSLSLNNAGDWAIRDALDDTDVLSNEVIVKNGVKFVQEGDVLPAVAPFNLRKFGLGAAHLSDSGSILWFARWSDPDATRNEGLFLDDRLIVQKGVTVATDGTLVAGIDDRDGKHYISPDGRYVIFLGYREDGKQVVFMLDLENPVAQLCFGTGIGVSCPCGNEGQPGYGCDNANGLGGARLSASGEPSLTADTMTFTVEGLPRSTPLVFMQGTVTSAPIFFGNGLRCFDGTLTRFGGRFAEGNESAVGFGIGSDAALSVQGAVGAPGERIYQVLYRNRSAFCSGVGLNTSNAVRLIWGP